jgi:protein associated with RNAse G/E
MNEVKVGDVLKIQSYKHNGVVYKNWDDTIILEVNDNYIVCANNKARVTEIDGRKWNTNELAIIFFYKDKWFNVIAQFKKDGIYYYCNIETPYAIEDKTIKYIDYDIDLRIFPDNTYKVLDEREYEYHRSKMKYSDDIDKIVKYEINNLLNIYKNKENPFNKDYLMKYYEIYKKIKKN